MLAALPYVVVEDVLCRLIAGEVVVKRGEGIVSRLIAGDVPEAWRVRVGREGESLVVSRLIAG